MTELLLWLAFFGIINAIYMSYHTYMGTSTYCLFFRKESCEKVQRSRYTKTFGVPNPYLGLSILILIVVLTLRYTGRLISFTPAFVIICAAFFFSCYFMYLQARVLKAYCTWCVISCLIFTAIFIIGLFIIMR